MQSLNPEIQGSRLMVIRGTYLLKRICILQIILKHLKVHVWMDDLRFYILFNSVSVISG